MTRNNGEAEAAAIVLRTLAQDAPDTLLTAAFPALFPAEARQGLVRLAEGLAAPAAKGTAPAAEPSLPKPAAGHGLHLQLYTDGAARGNPGPAGAGVVLLDGQGVELVAQGRYLGQCTNNVAEYQAVLDGLRAAHAAGAASLDIFLDSELIVRQLQGVYRVKDAKLIPLHAAARGELARFASWKVRHVPRHLNSRADELANEGIDRRGG